MPLFEAEGCMLSARIHLGEGETDKAREARDLAAELIARHHWRAAEPEAAVLDIELALAEDADEARLEDLRNRAVELVKGKPHTDEQTGRTIDGGWFYLRPLLAACCEAGDPRLAALEAQQAAYNKERDDYLAQEQAQQEAELANEREQEDRHLFDPAFRAELNKAVIASGYSPLDELSLGRQRNFAPQFLNHKRQATGGGNP